MYWWLGPGRWGSCWRCSANGTCQRVMHGSLSSCLCMVPVVLCAGMACLCVWWRRAWSGCPTARPLGCTPGQSEDVSLGPSLRIRLLHIHTCRSTPPCIHSSPLDGPCRVPACVSPPCCLVPLWCVQDAGALPSSGHAGPAE